MDQYSQRQFPTKIRGTIVQTIVGKYVVPKWNLIKKVVQFLSPYFEAFSRGLTCVTVKISNITLEIVSKMPREV